MKLEPIIDVKPEKVLTCQACNCGKQPIWNSQLDSFECPECKCGQHDRLWSLSRWNQMVKEQIGAQKRTYKKRKHYVKTIM